MDTDGFDRVQASLNEVAMNVSKLDTFQYDKIIDRLKPLESAKLKVALAYSLASLQFIMLQHRGEDIRMHPVQEDITRIKGYVQEVNTLEKLPTKRLAVDEAAASRIIQFQLNKNIAELNASDARPRKKQKK